MDGSEQHDRNALMAVCSTLESVREALDEGDASDARERLAKRIGLLAGRVQVWPYDPIPSRTAFWERKKYSHGINYLWRLRRLG